MSTNNPITIITPVYNRADCVLRCLNSVAQQQHLIDRHIVVNDGSTDQTAEIVKKFAAAHPYVQFAEFSQNRGTNAARNYAISLAQSKFIMILDSDDELVPGAMAQILDFMRKYPQYSHYMFAASDMLLIYDQMPILQNKKIVELDFCNAIRREFTGDFIHVISSQTMKKYPFDETYRIFEGGNFLRFYKEAGTFVFCRIMVVKRERDREDSVTRTAVLTNTPALRRSWMAIKFRWDYFFSDYVKFRADRILATECRNLCLLSVALSEYKLYRQIRKALNYNFLKMSLNFLTAIHGGRILKWCIIGYNYYFRKDKQ